MAKALSEWKAGWRTADGVRGLVECLVGEATVDTRDFNHATNHTATQLCSTRPKTASKLPMMKTGL